MISHGHKNRAGCVDDRPPEEVFGIGFVKHAISQRDGKRGCGNHHQSQGSRQEIQIQVELAPVRFRRGALPRTGEVLPDTAVEEIRKFDAIFLGAVGHPEVKPGILEKGMLLRLRFELDQYINLRPVKLYRGVDCPLKDKDPEDMDFVVVRENTEGLYTGAGGFLPRARRRKWRPGLDQHAPGRRALPAVRFRACE